MADTENAPLEEPGQRTGEGSDSILPHLHRQAQTQLRVPTRQPKHEAEPQPDSELPSQ
jgi:hypothetical protein